MVCKAKAHLEFNLASGWEARRKASFCTSIISKRRFCCEKCGLTAECERGTGNKGHRNSQGTQHLLLLSLFWKIPDPETTGKAWSKKTYLCWKRIVRKHLNKLDIHKNLGPNRMQPLSTEGACWCHCKANLNYLWKTMAFGILRSPEKKHNVTLIFKTCKKTWGTTCWSAAPVPLKEQVVLETIFKCINYKVIGEMEREIMLVLNSFPQLVYEKRVVEFVYLNFIKAFNIATHKILTGKMIGKQWDELKTGWTARFQGFWSAAGSPVGDQPQVVQPSRHCCLTSSLVT